MPRRHRELPKVSTKFYVSQPVVVVPLPKMRQLLDHLEAIGREEKLSIQERAQLRKQHSVQLSDVRNEVRKAYAYYGITSSHTPKPKSE